LVPELLREFEADPGLKALDAARRVMDRHPGGAASPDHRALHLLRLVKQEMARPGLPGLELVLTWQRCNRVGQRLHQRMREENALAEAKIAAARRRWGELWPAAKMSPHNHRETVEEFLASLDEQLKYKTTFNS
jgi:hypothetical protein